MRWRRWRRSKNEGCNVAELKTRKTGASVSEFINSIDDDRRRKDCKAIAALMQKATKSKPKMWGPSIVGFGDFEYVNSTKKPQQWFQCGFSPRKQALTLYIDRGFPRSDALIEKLGVSKPGGSCLYVKRLADVDMKALQALLEASVKHLRSARV
jgi:hypothetical protein